jgi:hypothetical protein
MRTKLAVLVLVAAKAALSFYADADAPLRMRRLLIRA